MIFWKVFWKIAPNIDSSENKIVVDRAFDLRLKQVLA